MSNYSGIKFSFLGKRIFSVPSDEWHTESAENFKTIALQTSVFMSMLIN